MLKSKYIALICPYCDLIDAYDYLAWEVYCKHCYSTFLVFKSHYFLPAKQNDWAALPVAPEKEKSTLEQALGKLNKILQRLIQYKER